MPSHQPVAAQDEHRVLKFRPRSSDTLRDNSDTLRDNDDAIVPDEGHQPDDFNHRMWANAAAFAFTVALTAFGIWLAVRMSDVRTAQDCVLIGRRDCARLAAPPPATLSTEPTAHRH